MCFSPKIPKTEPIEQKQAAKQPVTRSGERRSTGIQGTASPSTGRAGTILTGGGGSSPSAPTAKKTLLGQ